MDLKRYTKKAQEALVAAEGLATEYGHPQLEPIHMLIALMQQPDGVVPDVVARIGARPASLLAELEQILNDRPRVSGSNAQPTLSRQMVNVMTQAEREASK